MASIMAIVSKAIFDKEAKGLTPGALWPTARYASQNKGLASLADGGDLYLVTVRPPDEALWLVAILRAPKAADGGWRAKPNETRIVSISRLKSTLKFESGLGLPAKAGALGMSLQTPRVLTADDVAQLARLAGSTEEEAPAPKSKAAAKPKPVAMPKAARRRADEPATETTGGLSELDAALDHLKAGRAAAAVDDILAAWRKLRAPALGELLALVDKQVQRSLEPVDEAGWLDIASKRRAIDVGRLVATLGDTAVVRMKQRYELLLAFAPDPRPIATALAIPPRFSYEAGPSMTRAFEMAERAADPASREHVEAALRALAPTKGDSKGWKAYLAKHRRRGEKVLAALPAKVAVTPAVNAQIDACVAACRKLLGDKEVPARALATPTKKLTGGAKVIEALLAAVLDNPEDDAARIVYADALQQKGDPRGEFIALQLAGKSSTKKRERELLEAHVSDWLDPIGAAIRPDSVRFARGFLDACQVELKTPKQEALFAHPLWSTVRELDCEHMALVTRANLASLRRATVSPSGLSTLAGREQPVPLEAVIGPLQMAYGLRIRRGVDVETPAKWGRALDVGALTSLASLELDTWTGGEDGRTLATPDDWAWLTTSKLGKQLAELDLWGGRSALPIASWIDYVAQRGQRVRLRFTNGNTASGSREYLAVFELVRNGKLVDVTLSLNQDMGDIRYYAIGGQIARAVAGVPRRLAPSIAVRYIGSKKRDVLGFPGIAPTLHAAFKTVALT